MTTTSCESQSGQGARTLAPGALDPSNASDNDLVSLDIALDAIVPELAHAPIVPLPETALSADGEPTSQSHKHDKTPDGPSLDGVCADGVHIRPHNNAYPAIAARLHRRHRTLCAGSEETRGRARSWIARHGAAMGISLIIHALAAIAGGMMIVGLAHPENRRDLVISIESPALASVEDLDEVPPALQDNGDDQSVMTDAARAEPLPIAPDLRPEPATTMATTPPLSANAVAESEPATADLAAVRESISNVLPPMERWASGARRRGGNAPDDLERAGRATRHDRVVDRAPRKTGEVRFAGAGSSDAMSVVYAVDASGPMVTSLPLVLAELRSSVDRLSPEQSFSVVLFREPNRAEEMGTQVFSSTLVPATSEHKQQLAAWLETVRPGGRSDPLTGLDRALSLRPNVVFLLSRSVERSSGGIWGNGLEATIARLESLNPPIGPDVETPAARVGRAVQIQAIAFLDDDPTGILQAIAERHGPRDGSGYRVIRGSEELARGR